jgi:hypothetical protein
MALPPDIQQRIARAKANGFTDAQIAADLQRKYGVGMDAASAPRQPQSLLGSSPKLEAVASVTGGKQVARLGATLGFLASKEKKAADTSQQQLDELTQKYVRETLAKFAPGDPRRERALKLAGGGYAETSAFQDDVANTGPNGREVAADIGKLALTAVGAKTPANFTGKLALTRSAGASAGIGAGSGALNAVEAGKNPADVVKAAAAGGATAGVLRAGTGLIGRLYGKATNELPQTIYKTSTQMRRQDNALPLLREGITGNRSQLIAKSRDMIQDAGETMKGSSEAAQILDPKKALEYGPLKAYLEQQKRLGPEEYEAALKVVAAKVMRPAQHRATLNALREALDAQSPPGVFTGKAHEIGSKTEGLVADAYRGLVKEGAPEFTEQLGRQQSAIQLRNAIEDQMRGKQGVPGFIAGLIQRTLLTPAVGTRIASLGYKAGEPFRRMSQNALIEAIRRAANVGTAEGIGRITGGL